jgi:hypothetical protein
MEEGGEHFRMRSFIICTLHQILLECWISEDEVDSKCSTNGSTQKCVQNGPKQGNALSPLFFNFALEYVIRKAQVGPKLNGTHQLLFYADGVNLLGDNIDTIKRNTQTLIDASKEIGLEVNAENESICCCLVTRMQGKVMT